MKLDNLDKSKTYIGLQYGNSLIAKKIRKFSKDYAPDSKEIPTHVCGLVFRYEEWWVFESHADGIKKLGIPSGVRHYRAERWEDIEPKCNDEYKFYELPLSEKLLEEFIGQSYSLGDIESLLRASIFHRNGKQKDKRGLICSEYIASCCPQIIEYFDLPPYCITPAHFQKYVDDNSIKEVGA